MKIKIFLILKQLVGKDGKTQWIKESMIFKSLLKSTETKSYPSEMIKVGKLLSIVLPSHWQLESLDNRLSTSELSIDLLLEASDLIGSELSEVDNGDASVGAFVDVEFTEVGLYCIHVLLLIIIPFFQNLQVFNALAKNTDRNRQIPKNKFILHIPKYHISIKKMLIFSLFVDLAVGLLIIIGSNRFIMIVLIPIILALVLAQQHPNLTAQNTIKYTLLLNYGENISVTLSDYLNVPAEARINKVGSLNLDALSYAFIKEPMRNISSLKLSATLRNGTLYTFNQSQVLQTCSLYNQPNKIFLMKNNIILSVRYQFTVSDQASSINVLQINDSVNCVGLNKIEFNSSYYIQVGCLNKLNQSLIYLYKFNATNSSMIGELSLINSIKIVNNACVRMKFYSFQQLQLNTITYNQSILFLCAERLEHKPSKLYVLSVKSKGSDNLSYVQINTTQQKAAGVLQQCLIDCKWIQNYQKGVIIRRNDSLYYFKYDKSSNSASCDLINIPEGLIFAYSIEDRGIQYIYLLFNDKIIIKESYSPNFQTIQIQRINNSTLKNFAISRKLLTLFFFNSTHNCTLVYDLVKVYPKQIDRIIAAASDTTQITAYSVNNFLQSGNYLLIYNQTTNQLTLNFYQGYQFIFNVINSSIKVPNATVKLQNNLQQSIIIQVCIRDFTDLSISPVEGSNFLKTYRELVNINLTGYTQGPLGRFYIYPNNISAFEYINQYSQINISWYFNQYQRPLSISFNNYLDAAIINFYYSSETNTCELDFDYQTKQVTLSLCKTLKRKKLVLEVAKQIVVLSEDTYIQYNQSFIQYCSLSSNNQFECINIQIVEMSRYQKIKLVEYVYDKSTDELVEMIIYNTDEIVFCCLHRNVYRKQNFSINIHYHTSALNLPILATWKIQQLLFDQGYQQFLALHLKGADNTHKVMIFDKLASDMNSISFIGHTIQTYNFSNLEAIFTINRLLICLYSQNSVWMMKEYKITRYYTVKQTRLYPLYHFNIVPNGSHVQNQEFIYIEALQYGKPAYLVYSPLENSFNVLSHKFQKKNAFPLIFAQQLGADNNNSMAINGNWLFGLTSPTLLFKFITESTSSSPKMGKYNFQASVMDSTNKMTILAYEFTYNQGQQSIRFDGDPSILIQFNQTSSFSTFQIDPDKVIGPASSYHLSLPNDDSCSFFTVEQRDIFTKQGCLVYSNPNKSGTLNDFLAITVPGGANIELLITQTSIYCVVNRKLDQKNAQDIIGMVNCKFQTSYTSILMICDNSTANGKLVYNVTAYANDKNCILLIQEIALPTWLGYQDFQIEFSESYFMFEVPIRYQLNCIYYKTTLRNGEINRQNYSLLVGVSNTNSQFQTVDTSIYGELYFVMVNEGIGIYNLNNSNTQIMPALWLTKADIFNVPNDDGALVYLQCLSAKPSPLNQSLKQITIQIGTQRSTYQVLLIVHDVSNSSSNQSTYNRISVQIIYQYKQYMSCHNNIQSKSQKYGNLIVKICDYQPPQELVFANFISIANQTTGALIQFYNRDGGSSYPFRIDTIYSNFFSHHSFVIRNNTLVVASLFNFLCYYALATTLSWQFIQKPINIAVFDAENQQKDKQCAGSLMISNLNYNKELTFTILLDNDQYQSQYWTNGTYYIQRVILFLILLNTIRLLIRARRSSNRIRLRKKLTGGRLHTSKFQVMVKINSKMSN